MPRPNPNYKLPVHNPKRLNPRVIELPFVLNNMKPGNVLNIGGRRGEWKWTLIDKHLMTIVDIIKPPTHPKIKSIQGDIRTLTPRELGLFDNIILMSTLEHISLASQDPSSKLDSWKSSPRAEQLKVFQHCMTFLKPGGHMLFTIPCGIPIEKPIHKLHYNTEMLEDLKKGYKTLKETYYKRPGTDWIECSGLPSDLFSQEEEINMQRQNTITRALQLMVITNK